MTLDCRSRTETGRQALHLTPQVPMATAAQEEDLKEWTTVPAASDVVGERAQIADQPINAALLRQGAPASAAGHKAPAPSSAAARLQARLASRGKAPAASQGAGAPPAAGLAVPAAPAGPTATRRSSSLSLPAASPQCKPEQALPKAKALAQTNPGPVLAMDLLAAPLQHQVPEQPLPRAMALTQSMPGPAVSAAVPSQGKAQQAAHQSQLAVSSTAEPQFASLATPGLRIVQRTPELANSVAARSAALAAVIAAPAAPGSAACAVWAAGGSTLDQVEAAAAQSPAAAAPGALLGACISAAPPVGASSESAAPPAPAVAAPGAAPATGEAAALAPPAASKAAAPQPEIQAAKPAAGRVPDSAPARTSSWGWSSLSGALLNVRQLVDGVLQVGRPENCASCTDALIFTALCEHRVPKPAFKLTQKYFPSGCFQAYLCQKPLLEAYTCRYLPHC